MEEPTFPFNNSLETVEFESIRETVLLCVVIESTYVRFVERFNLDKN